MATNNAVNTSLSGQTGTVNFVGSTSPTLITPTLGAATATSVTFSPTTGGIIGTTTNDNAGAGKVGEFISSTIASGSATSLVTATAKNVTTISLTAGDWDVFGNVTFLAAGTTTSAQAWISTTSATLPDSSLASLWGSSANGTSQGLVCPYVRISIAGTTTVYLSCQSAFTSTTTACGGIFARRAR